MPTKYCTQPSKSPKLFSPYNDVCQVVPLQIVHLIPLQKPASYVASQSLEMWGIHMRGERRNAKTALSG